MVPLTSNVPVVALGGIAVQLPKRYNNFDKNFTNTNVLLTEIVLISQSLFETILVVFCGKIEPDVKRVGYCIGVDQICGIGLECRRGHCVREQKTGLTRRKRDTGLKCSSGLQASSICFAPSSCGTYGNYMGSPGCCGDSSYHCESTPYGNVCCQNSPPSLVTVTPTPTVPVIPCVGPYCSATTLTPYSQNDDCIPHYVPQFGQTVLLCPEGKICRENKCVLAVCQPSVCPIGKQKIGLCHFSAVNNQVCSSTGATCFDGVCCEQKILRLIFVVNTAPPIVPSVAPSSICAPSLPAYCANPYNFRMNGCCRKKRR
uniref:CC domain-containing protein n=1 Tax=Romanomermis culicivorax TaxID=13658 RepID=A0A915ILL3_ROMCU